MEPFKVALKEYGEKEIKGSQHNPRIVEYFAKCGHSWVKDDETAWCAAFMGFCLETAGIKSTRQLNARSYLNFGTPVAVPSLGDIVVFWRGSKNGWEGHVGFFIKETNTGILTLGGNQADQVFIAEYPKNQLLGYRKINEVNEKCSIKQFTLMQLVEELKSKLNDIIK